VKLNVTDVHSASKGPSSAPRLSSCKTHLRVVAEIALATDQDERHVGAEVTHLRNPLRVGKDQPNVGGLIKSGRRACVCVFVWSPTATPFRWLRLDPPPPPGHIKFGAMPCVSFSGGGGG